MSQENPQAGDIAICSVGCLGLITVNEPVDITYNDGNKGKAYIGIQLAVHTFKGKGKDADKEISVVPGGPWSSRKPKVIGSILEFRDNILRAMISSGRF